MAAGSRHVHRRGHSQESPRLPTSAHVASGEIGAACRIRQKNRDVWPRGRPPRNLNSSSGTGNGEHTCPFRRVTADGSRLPPFPQAEPVAALRKRSQTPAPVASGGSREGQSGGAVCGPLR